MHEDDDHEQPKVQDDGFEHLGEDHPSRGKSYNTGKNKPPVTTRFPKGVSGNPKGKKKGRHVANMIRDEILAPVAIRTPSGKKKVPALVAQFLMVQQESLSGNAKAREQYFKIAQNLILNEPPPIEDEALPEDDEAIIAEHIARRFGQPLPDPDTGMEDEDEKEEG
ncbi:MAG: hypothetical protein BGO03_02370 [Mesorhizobium sp. 61-13]|nr:hypothetical protein [Mesorhizobium sp.]OJU51564.1 MAG: hypothetical protein BGO03_02370 [Mesorhizobium sp. 61-13]